MLFRSNQNIVERDGLLKIKVNTRKTEAANANKVLEKHLANTDDIYKIVDAVYAMGRTNEERIGLKRERKNKRKIREREMRTEGYENWKNR